MLFGDWVNGENNRILISEYGFINLHTRHSEGLGREPSLLECCLAIRKWTLTSSIPDLETGKDLHDKIGSVSVWAVVMLKA